MQWYVPLACTRSLSTDRVIEMPSWHATAVALRSNKSRCVNEDVISLWSTAINSTTRWWGDEQMERISFSILHNSSRSTAFRHSAQPKASNNCPASSIFRNVPTKCGCNLYIWMLPTHFCHYSLKSVIVVYTNSHYKLLLNQIECALLVLVLALEIKITKRVEQNR